MLRVPNVYEKVPYRLFTISSIEIYERAIKGGFLPLVDWRHFYIEKKLRLSIQYKEFGKTDLGQGSVIKANDLFYHYCYKNSAAKACEECVTPLMYYSSKYVSHILSRKQAPEMAHDPRNYNLLCPECHRKWENEPEMMKIYNTNQIVIAILKYDYEFSE